ncbi:EthD family reductase [Candidatus Thalassolituus haligoni]|uniref:EthD family reductase n=1 Tax=Candidatus Thalassolituus haligoni TaxID=3100113 RepID=UPI003517B373|tara:strand:+ start:7603 stop:7932 length:330 start_codon:yes stop_codon:yes gene_type:complete
MIKINVMYPVTEGAGFDLDYYCNKHIPMVAGLLGSACKGIHVESGLCGGEPGRPARFEVMTGILFERLADYESSFAAAAGVLMADIPNFTTIQPWVEVTDVCIDQRESE